MTTLKGNGWIRINCYSRYLSIFIFAANTIFIFFLWELLPRQNVRNVGEFMSIRNSSFCVIHFLLYGCVCVCVVFSVLAFYFRRKRKIYYFFCRLCAAKPNNMFYIYKWFIKIICLYFTFDIYISKVLLNWIKKKKFTFTQIYIGGLEENIHAPYIARKNEMRNGNVTNCW